MHEIEDQLRRHGEWVRPQMPPLTRPGPDGLHSRDALDDARAVPTPVADEPRRPRPGRLAWAAVATAAAVAVVAATIAVVDTRSTPPAAGPHSNPPQTVTTGPDTALVPPSELGDLQLWSLTATTASVERGDSASSTTTSTVPSPTQSLLSRSRDGSYEQLFGRHGQPLLGIAARKLLLNEGRYSGLGTMSGPGLHQVSDSIRGRDGRLQSTTFPPGAPAASDDGHLTPMALIWNEGGFTITVTFRDLSASQARAFVDGLGVGQGGVANGFLAPSGSDLAPLPLPEPPDATPAGIIVDATYATSTAAASSLSMSTCPAGAGGCTPSYADLWIWGTRLVDGSVEGAMPGIGGPPALYARVWPDGQGIEISSYAAKALDVDLARQLTDRVVVGDRAQVVALQAQLSERLMSLPRVAAAAFDLGTVEVHAAGRLTAVCVAPAGHPMACTSATYSDPTTPPTAGFMGSVVSDGHWFVAAARQGTGPFGYYPDTADIGAGVLPQPIAGRSAQGLPAAGGWELGLVQVPDDLDHVVATHSGPSSIAGGGVARPAS